MFLKGQRKGVGEAEGGAEEGEAGGTYQNIRSHGLLFNFSFLFLNSFQVY